MSWTPDNVQSWMVGRRRVASGPTFGMLTHIHLSLCSVYSMTGTHLVLKSRVAGSRVFRLSPAARIITIGQNWTQISGVAFTSITRCLQKWQDITLHPASPHREAMWQFRTEGRSSGDKVFPGDRQSSCQTWNRDAVCPCLCLLTDWAKSDAMKSREQKKHSGTSPLCQTAG